MFYALSKEFGFRPEDIAHLTLLQVCHYSEQMSRAAQEQSSGKRSPTSWDLDHAPQYAKHKDAIEAYRKQLREQGK